MPNWLSLRSLRKRYLLVALLLAVGILSIALLADRHVSHSTQTSTANIDARYEATQHIRLIKDAVLDIKTSLENFLLAPEQQSRQAALNHTLDALRHVHMLKEGVAGNGFNTQHTADLLETQFNKLFDELKQVMTARVTSDLQYPVLRYMRENLQPLYNTFLNQLALMLQEIDPRDAPLSYAQLTQLRYNWNQLIGQFRLYLINRMASASIAKLPAHENDIREYHQQIMQGLSQLRRLQAQEQLQLLDADSLDILSQSAADWFVAFEYVRDQLPANAWRADQLLLEKNTQPLFSAIWTTLRSYDQGIEASGHNDITTLNRLAGSISDSLWLLAIGISLLVTLGYLVFTRSILNPLQIMSRAIKAEAHDVSGQVALPQATTLETQELVEAFTNLRRQVRYRQMALEYQAMHDTLTSLPNRLLLNDRLAQEIRMAERNRQPLALIMLDLDRFKEINDTLGHHIGDLVLRQVGARITRLLRASDTVARLGGDEFAVILHEAGLEDASQVAAKITQALEEVITLDEHKLHVGASQGIALYPRHGDTPQELLQRADVAMYVAKRSKHHYAFYSPEQDQHSLHQLELTNDLRHAIHYNELMLYYQPKLELSSGRIVAVEALLRWKHSIHGFISPIEIVTSAEKTGLISALSLWVIERAIEQCIAWQRERLELAIAVNLSVWNLHDPKLPEQIEGLLHKHGLDPEALTLEITETAMMAEPERALVTLGQLSAMGIRLSVDDYGTGFSSLSYLKRFPVDELKIDRAFVMDMHQDDNDAVIVRSTIDLGHNLGLKVVAEGVEDQASLELLDILGCDILQGYHIGRPVPAHEITALLSVPLQQRH